MDVNAVAILFVVITTLYPVTTNRIEASYVVTLFIVTDQNVVIITNRVATALTSIAKRSLLLQNGLRFYSLLVD